ANPALFRLLSDPARVARSAAAESGRRVLEARVHRVAAAGQLRVTETRAVGMIQAAGIGVIQTLLATPPEHRDPELAQAMYDAVLARTLTARPELPDARPLAAAVTFRAIAPQLTMLSNAERSLLDDWLARVLNPLQTPARPGQALARSLDGGPGGSRPGWPRSDAPVGVAVRGDAAGCAVIETLDRRDLLVGQIEVEDVEVLGHPLRPGGLRDRDDAALHVPAQDDLRDALAVLAGDRRDRRVAERCAVVAERAV